MKTREGKILILPQLYFFLKTLRKSRAVQLSLCNKSYDRLFHLYRKKYLLKNILRRCFTSEICNKTTTEDLNILNTRKKSLAFTTHHTLHMFLKSLSEH